MSKYSRLTDFLRGLARDEETEWTPSFDEVEEVMGERLPPSARQHRPWWANQGRAHSLAWETAGWKTSDVDVEDEELTFLYLGEEPEQDQEAIGKLTIAEAKAGLAANFGVPVDAVEITIRG
ncbi:MAG TPA: hypothetical protein VHS33_08675 [Sphingomicrobium sp.]|jgi:hypothetical protein|nr:hypothetical protein [Sphingomicrobium sp.]